VKQLPSHVTKTQSTSHPANKQQQKQQKQLFNCVPKFVALLLSEQQYSMSVVYKNENR